jgi:cytochrome subunit of sulfide dehydrogenase
MRILFRYALHRMRGQPKTTAAAPADALSYRSVAPRVRPRRNDDAVHPSEASPVNFPAVVAAAALAAAVPVAMAQGSSPDPAVGRSVAATCANCHGTGGRAAPGSAVPGLAGRSREEIVRRMNEFRDGQRQATIMHQLAKGYTPAQIDAVAAYFAAQK